ncbi:uncharacterized protein LOC134280499 [Saccostrea cucullata]|uniref:uncharacterized protein LOC134280499 n=1 Tax=Saccostrea cuccullata TaxID=36930 RepID=UPI002ED3FBAD
MSLKRKDAMRSKRNRQAMAFTDKEHEKINILVEKVESKHEDKIHEVKKMVTEVTGIMKDNIEKVVEREGKLNTLEVRTSELELSTSGSAGPSTDEGQTDMLSCMNQNQSQSSEEVVYRRKRKQISDDNRLKERSTEENCKECVETVHQGETLSNDQKKFSGKSVTEFEISENKGNETFAPSTPLKIDNSNSSSVATIQINEQGVSTLKTTGGTDYYVSPKNEETSSKPSKGLENKASALMSPVEIDIYSFPSLYGGKDDLCSSPARADNENKQNQNGEVLRRSRNSSEDMTSKSNPLQRHNAMKSRRNRSGVAFSDTEKLNIISNAEQIQSQTPSEEAGRRRKQRHVSDEVRLQVQEAKTSMEENIKKAEKTEKLLDDINIYGPSKVTKSRSLEDIGKEKTTPMKEELRPSSDGIGSTKSSALPVTEKAELIKETDAGPKPENKRKKKKPLTSSVEESESKIAFVKKKAKRAKVFLKERFTDHHNNTGNSKEYRANEGNSTTVFYTMESSAPSITSQTPAPSPPQLQEGQQKQQQNQTKKTNMEDLRGQVREVTNIMRNNVEEVAKRGEKLEELESRSGHLEDLSSSFAKCAANVKKKMKRRNRKLICAIALTITGIVLTVTVILLVYFLG